MRQVLLLLPTTSYRNGDFIRAAAKLNVEIIACANYCHQLAPTWGMGPLLSVPFDQPEIGLKKILAALGGIRPDAVLAVDDLGLELAALVREHLDLPGNPVSAVNKLRDKLAFRRLLRSDGLNCPRVHHLPEATDPMNLVPQLRFPVVVKARRLSASRGVIRAEGADEFTLAAERVRSIQKKADRDSLSLGIIVEDFIPGLEYAVEGVLEDGWLRVLALFDKPDPLDGPFFEETLYVTPSRLPASVRGAIAAAVQQVCTAAGLVEGPVHAEARVNSNGVWLLEAAARSIGGLCGRSLRHCLGMSLEELILRSALREDLPRSLDRLASGVMMIPIPRRGVYQGVTNLDAALAVPGITEITIAAEPGQVIAPPPDGSSYLGFIFARGDRPEKVEYALRDAHLRLWFDITPEISVEEVSS